VQAENYQHENRAEAARDTEEADALFGKTPSDATQR
jgi:hypothetical protein